MSAYSASAPVTARTTAPSTMNEAAPWLLRKPRAWTGFRAASTSGRSEEHTSELQSRLHLVCRLLLEKKKTEQAKRKLRLRRWSDAAYAVHLSPSETM